LTPSPTTLAAGVRAIRTKKVFGDMGRNAPEGWAGGRSLWGVLLVAALPLTGCGEAVGQLSAADAAASPPAVVRATPPGPARTEELPPPAATLIARFRDRGLPIGEVVVWPAESPPGATGPASGRYATKATFYDLRLERGPDPGIGAGGDVETFASEAELRARQEFLASVSPATGPPGHYAFSRGLVLLRVSKAFTPEQAAAYEEALAAALAR
jgi:hypothetical protein